MKALNFALAAQAAFVAVGMGQVSFAPYTCEYYESACKSDAERAAMRAKREKAAADAPVERFTDRFGKHREAEGRRLEELRRRAEAAKKKESLPKKTPADDASSKGPLRGFLGKTCEAAVRGAEVNGSKFEVVRSEMQPNGYCLVQGRFKSYGDAGSSKQ
jgi:hypothetical protein